MVNPGSFQPPLYGAQDLVARGTTQTTAWPLVAGGNVFTLVVPGGTAILPGPDQNQVLVFNQGANTLYVYPNFADRIGALAVNLPVAIEAGGSATFVSFDTPLTYPPRTWFQGATNTAAGVNVVADNSTTVSAVTRLQFSGNSVTDGGGGVAVIDVSPSSGVSSVVIDAPEFLTAGTITTTGTITSGVTLTNHGLVLGSGAGQPIRDTGTLGSAQILVGQASADPSAQTVAGDVTLNNTGTVSLAATGVSAGFYGDTTHVARFQVDAKGRVLAAADVLISAVGTVSSGNNITVTNGTGPNATVALGTIAATSLFGNAGTVAGTMAAIAIGSGLSLAPSGTLTAPAAASSLVVTDGTTTVTSTSTVTVSGGTVTDLGGGDAKITVTGGGGGGVTSVVVNASPFLNAGTITTTGTITAATLAASSLLGNSAGTAAVPGAIAIGANLTLNSGTLAASGAGGILLQAQASLSSANILSLNTAAVTLVPAPGVGFMVKPIASTIVYRHVSAPYTGGGNTNLFYGSSAGSSSGSAFASAFQVASNRVLLQIVNTSGTFTTAQVDNLALVLQSPTAYAGGDGTALLTVDYVVLPSS